MTLAAAAHVEHADTVILRQMLHDIQRLEPTAAQTMQINNALAIYPKIRVPYPLAATMPYQCTLQLLIPFVMDMLQILDDVLVLIQIEG